LPKWLIIAARNFLIDKLGDVIFTFGRFVFREQLLLSELIVDEAESQNDVGESLATAVFGQNSLQHGRCAGPNEVDFDLRESLFEAGLNGNGVRCVHRQVGYQSSFFLGLIGQSDVGRITR
jgi:hypothetical protein